MGECRAGVVASNGMSIVVSVLSKADNPINEGEAATERSVRLECAQVPMEDYSYTQAKLTCSLEKLIH